jgi:hypothetical protein
MKDTRRVMSIQKVQIAVTNKLGVVGSRWYLKDREDARINQPMVRNENREKRSVITC